MEPVVVEARELQYVVNNLYDKGYELRRMHGNRLLFMNEVNEEYEIEFKIDKVMVGYE